MRLICFWCLCVAMAAQAQNDEFYAPQTFRQHLESHQKSMFTPARNDVDPQASQLWQPAPVHENWRGSPLAPSAPLQPIKDPWRSPFSISKEQQANILHHKQALTSNGAFRFEYASDNGLAAGEQIEPDGSRVGAYQYKDPSGQLVKLKYRAGKDGFQILEGSHLPKSPEPVAPPTPDQHYQQAYQQQRQQYDLQQQYNQQRIEPQNWQGQNKVSQTYQQQRQQYDLQQQYNQQRIELRNWQGQNKVSQTYQQQRQQYDLQQQYNQQRIELRNWQGQNKVSQTYQQQRQQYDLQQQYNQQRIELRNWQGQNKVSQTYQQQRQQYDLQQQYNQQRIEPQNWQGQNKVSQTYQQQRQQYDLQQQYNQQRIEPQNWQGQNKGAEGGQRAAAAQYYPQSWRSGQEDDGQYRPAENEVESQNRGPHNFGEGYEFSFQG